jgi:hypothetical protein
MALQAGDIIRILNGPEKGKQSTVVQTENNGNLVRVAKINDTASQWYNSFEVEKIGVSGTGYPDRYRLKFDKKDFDHITDAVLYGAFKGPEKPSDFGRKKQEACECGVDSVGYGQHSNWCPKHDWIQ